MGPKTPTMIVICYENSRMQCTVFLMARIYYSDRIEREISNGKRCMEKRLGEARCNLPGIFSQWRLMGCAQLPSNEFWLHMWNDVLRRLTRGSTPRDFIGEASHRHSAWHLPKFQSLKRKGGIQPTPYCLHRRFRCMSCSYQLVMRILKSTFPDMGHQPTL